jgi:hypothetical protein
MPIPLHCEPRPVSRAALAVGLTAQRSWEGTNTRDLLSAAVTRLVIYPVIRCMTGHFCCKPHAVTFALGARYASLHPSTIIKGHRILLLWALDHKLNPQSPTRRSAGAPDTTEFHTKFQYRHFKYFKTTTAIFTNFNLKNWLCNRLYLEHNL